MGGLTEILPFEMMMAEFEFNQKKEKKEREKKSEFDPFIQKHIIKNSTGHHPIIDKINRSTSSNKALREIILDLIIKKLEKINQLQDSPKDGNSLKNIPIFGKTLGVKIDKEENPIFDRLPFHLLDIETVIKSRGEGKLSDPLFIKTKWTLEKFNRLTEIFGDEIAKILFEIISDTGYFSYRLGKNKANLSNQVVDKLAEAGIKNHSDIINRIMESDKTESEEKKQEVLRMSREEALLFLQERMPHLFST